MTFPQTVNPKANCSTPNVTDAVLPDKASPKLYPLKEEKWGKPSVFIKRHQQHRRVLKTQRKTWVPLLFCIFALVALLTSCFRAGRIGTLSSKSTNKNTSTGRRLAQSGGQPEGADDEEAKILEMCLDLEEAAGTIISPFPLTQNEAIPLILRFLNEPSFQQLPEAIQHSGAGSPLYSPPLISDANAPSPQPGPSHVEPTAGWGGPLYFSPSYHQEDLSLQEVLSPSWQASQSPLQLLQTQQEQETSPRESEPATSKPETAAERGKNQPGPGEPPPKKHTSGWKGEKPAPASASGAPSCSHQQQSVGLDDESIEVDPLLQAVQATGEEECSPPPLDIPESVGETAEELDAPILSPSGSLSEMSRMPSLQLLPLRETPPTLSPPEREGEEEELFFLNSPGPFISQELRPALPAPPQEDSLPGPSGKTSSPATPLLSSDEESAESETLSPSSSSVSSPGSPAAPQPEPVTTHLFYRLPVLQAGRIMQRFIVNRAFCEANEHARSQSYLNKMRSILAQPVITSIGAASLVAHSEIVAGRVLEELQIPIDPSRPSMAVRHLGRIYLALDALVSAVEVLGPVMNADEWWPTIQEKVPSRQAYVAGRNKYASITQAALATDLSEALQTLRHCVRLPERETIELKRRLLCSEDTVAEFKFQRWDPWREDDEKSGKSGAIE